MYYIYNKSSTYRGQYRAEERNRNSQNLNCGHCRDKINLLLGVGMVRSFFSTKEDMRVGKGLTVDSMLMQEHRRTEDILHKQQEHQRCKKTFRYVVYSTHLRLQIYEKKTIQQKK